METLVDFFKKIPNWLRWILIFPTSIFTYFVADFLTNILGKLAIFFSRDPWSDKVFTHLLAPGVAGYSSIVIAIAMAPKGQGQVAMLMTGIWLVAYGAMITVAFASGDWKSAIPGVASAVASLYAYINYRPKNTNYLSTTNEDVI